MRISDLQIGRGYAFDLIPAIKGVQFAFAIGQHEEQPCQLFEFGGETHLELLGQSIAVECKNAKVQADLEELLRDRDRSAVSIIYNSDSEVSIGARVFADSYLSPEAIDFGLGDIIMDDIKTRYPKFASTPRKALEWLRSQAVFDLGKRQQAILISKGPSSTKTLNSFRILGKEIFLDIVRNDEGQLEISRIVNKQRPKTSDSSPIIMFKAPQLNVLDITTAAKTRASVQKEMEAIVASGAAYISLWEEYNQLEREKAEAIALEMGKIQYDGFRFDPQSEGYWFKIRSNWDKVQEFLSIAEEYKLSIEVDEQLPYFLKGIPHTSAEAMRKKRWIGEIVNRRQAESEILLRRSKREEVPTLPKQGFLFGSMLGTEVSLDRREKAAEIIRSGTAPMPQISLILEDRAVPIRSARQIVPITPAVRRAFTYPFNPQQQEAISLALNTPDIALIQGPPGTGKTQVIAAICIRLAEEAKTRNESPSKMVLLTAFQHDAVANVAERTRVMGLPSLKVDKNSNGIQIIDRWSLQVQELLKNDLAMLPQSTTAATRKEVLKNFQRFKKGDLTVAELKNLLQEIKSLVKEYVSVDLALRIRKEIDALGVPNPVGTESIQHENTVNALRSLRTTLVAWSDDGPSSLRKLLIRLSQSKMPIDPDVKDWLEGLPGTTPSEEDFLKLQKVQVELLAHFAEANLSSNLGPPTAGIERIFIEILDTLNERIANSPDGIPSILEEYLEDLSQDQDAAREAIAAYTAVLAATVQGADSAYVSKALGGMEQEFDTVIVDEAARVNPLDLFIAFTKAKRRIILVGDHRQLPQIIEHDLENALLTNQSHAARAEEVQKVLKMSLFERLFLHLKKQEAMDGRKRTITLNEQYRMHPMLGNFISKTFYESMGDVTIENKTDQAKLAHPFTEFAGKVAIWKPVSTRDGQEVKCGSIMRVAEARAILPLLASLMERAPELSFGVITFYGEQVNAIMREGLKHNLTEKDEEGHIVISARHRLTDKNEERLRIGTVDAFQGKEFDVVILSTVRSNDIPVDINDLATIRKKYGFLTLSNRLNVAMSRAKRLLIVVGDKSMFDTPIAEQYISGLYDFLQLTHSSHGKRHD